MGVTVIVLGVVAAAASAYSAYATYTAQQQAADYNKKVAHNQAQAARDAASIARQNRQEELRHILAAQRARIGASGITDAGSPLLVQMESATQAQLELSRITYAGATRATGYTQESILQGFYATKAEQAAYAGAGTALLSGASSTATGYYYGKR